MTDTPTMHARFQKLIAQAQEKLDAYSAEHQDKPTDLSSVRHQLNVTDWYLSAALHDIVDKLDEIEQRQDALFQLVADARDRLYNIDGEDGE